MTDLFTDMRRVVVERMDDPTHPLPLTREQGEVELELIAAKERAYSGLGMTPPAPDPRTAEQVAFDRATRLPEYAPADFVKAGLDNPAEIDFVRRMHLHPTSPMLRDIRDAAKEGATPPADYLFAYRPPNGNRDPRAEAVARAEHVKEATEALRQIGGPLAPTIRVANMPAHQLNLIIKTAEIKGRIGKSRPR
jgi:hypothetical protein